MQTKSQTLLTSQKYQTNNGPMVPEPFYPTSIKDFCINCESSQKIIGTITLGQRSGSICVKCFKANQK
jgi:hypothetical protein